VKVPLFPFPLKSARRPLHTVVSISQYQTSEVSLVRRTEGEVILDFIATSFVPLPERVSVSLNTTKYPVLVFTTSTSVPLSCIG
jgi:hypothetical protein